MRGRFYVSATSEPKKLKNHIWTPFKYITAVTAQACPINWCPNDMQDLVVLMPLYYFFNFIKQTISNVYTENTK